MDTTYLRPQLSSPGSLPWELWVKEERHFTKTLEIRTGKESKWMGDPSRMVAIRPFEKWGSDSIQMFQNISLHAYRLAYLSARFREPSIPDTKTSFRCQHNPSSAILWEAREDQRNWPKTKDYILWLSPMGKRQRRKASALWNMNLSLPWRPNQPLDVLRLVLK